MLDIFALRHQIAPTEVSVLVFQETPAEAVGPPLRLMRPELSASRLSVIYFAGEISRPADLRGELALALLKRLI
jgi:hypothetical protein